MGNVFAIIQPILHGVIKLAGTRPQALEIEGGTTMNFWVPSQAPSSKPAVVFLHGFAADGIITWSFQVLSLAKDYAVYVPDLVFFGGSTTDRAARTTEFQAECVAEGLRKLGVEKCTIVGLSYGGMVGFKMAEMYPDMVEAIVVTCSVIALTDSISNASLARIGFSNWSDYLVPDSVKGVRDLFETAIYELPHFPDWIYQQYLDVMFEKRKEMKELLEALVIPDEDFTVPNLTLQKVYLLWGGNDKIFDVDTANDLNRQLGNTASVDLIERAGHLVQLERSSIYNKKLRNILADVYENKHQD